MRHLRHQHLFKHAVFLLLAIAFVLLLIGFQLVIIQAANERQKYHLPLPAHRGTHPCAGASYISESPLNANCELPVNP